MTQTLFRVLLGLLLLGSIIVALSKHGQQIPAYRFHAGAYVLGIVVEALLILMAGGWG